MVTTAHIPNWDEKQKLAIEILKPAGESGKHTFAALLVDDTFVIELLWTVMGSIRVCWRYKNDGGYMTNWCAGNEEFHVLILLNVTLGYIEAGHTAQMPFCSKVKPYYKDAEFVDTICHHAMPQFYFTRTDQLLATESTTKLTTDYEDF